MKEIFLTAEYALQLTNQSEAALQANIKMIEQKIKEAANDGQRKIYFPQYTGQQGLAEKLKEHFVLNGFKIDRYSSDIWNTAIHW